MQNNRGREVGDTKWWMIGVGERLTHCGILDGRRGFPAWIRHVTMEERAALDFGEEENIEVTGEQDQGGEEG